CQAEDGIRDFHVTGVQTCALPISPVLTGALFRLPLGLWTDRFGGHRVMMILLIVCAIPVWFAATATALWQFLLLGLALGILGARSEERRVGKERRDRVSRE